MNEQRGWYAYFADGRHRLAAVLQRYAAKGLTPVAAMEVEFYLLDPSSSEIAAADGGVFAQAGGFDSIYSIGELDAFAPFLDDVSALAERGRIAVEAAISEGGPRQFEFNLLHKADALRVADDTVYFKQILRHVARRHGHLASFIAKPHSSRAGSGLHPHFSILGATGRHIFDNGTPGARRKCCWQSAA